MKSDKNLAIALLWAAMAILVATFFFLRREKTATRPIQASVTQQSVAPCKSDKFTLVTLNDILIRSQSMELISKNVAPFKKFAEYSANFTRGLVLIFTLPDGSSDISEKLKDDIENILQSSGIEEAGFRTHRLVFTLTRDSRISLGRQIEADVFFDPDPTVLNELTGKVPRIVCVDENTFKGFVTVNFFEKDHHR